MSDLAGNSFDWTSEFVLASTTITGLTGARVLWGATTCRCIGWGDSHETALHAAPLT